MQFDVPVRRSSLEHPFNSSKKKNNPFFKKRKTVDSPAALRSKPPDISASVLSPARPMQLDFEAQRPNIISNIEMIQEEEGMQLGEAAATVQPQNEDDLPVLIQSPANSNFQVSFQVRLMLKCHLLLIIV